MDNKTIKKITYFARVESSTHPGVINKINQTVEALKHLGHNADAKIIKVKPTASSLLELCATIIKSKSDLILLRVDVLLPFLVLPLLLQRIRGKKVILDIPTPFSVAVNEILVDQKNWLAVVKSKLKIAFIYIFFPVSFFVGNKIIHYAKESSYFSLGLSGKTKVATNGINVNSIKNRVDMPSWPAKEFIMVGVASLAEWHAFDRVIRGMADYRNDVKKNVVNPRLIIVGDGVVRSKWEDLTSQLNLNDCVFFAGYQTGVGLECLINQAHIAISSLGLYRIGLEEASVLKAREYTARGIPFISAGYDADFEPQPFFVHRIENNNSAIDIKKVIEWYSEISNIYNLGLEIREYAKMNLDLTVKVNDLIS